MSDHPTQTQPKAPTPAAPAMQVRAPDGSVHIEYSTNWIHRELARYEQMLRSLSKR